MLKQILLETIKKSLCVAMATLAFVSVGQAAKLVIYTDRSMDQLAPAAQVLNVERHAAKQEPVELELVSPSSGRSYVDLIQQAKKDGANSNADLFIANDMYFAHVLKTQNLLVPLNASSELNHVPTFMRDSHWTAISFRVRTAVYNPNAFTDEPEKILRIEPEFLTEAQKSKIANTYVAEANQRRFQGETYHGLANILNSASDWSQEAMKWDESLCLRSSAHPYNQGLVGYLNQSLGEAGAVEVLRGWVKSLSILSPIPSDRALLEKALSGTQGIECPVVLVNHYYYAMAVNDNRTQGRPELPTRIVFLNQVVAGKQGSVDKKLIGTHANGVIAGVADVSQQKALANRFIQILLTPEVQKALTAAPSSFHFPVALQQQPAADVDVFHSKMFVEPATLIRNWPQFRISSLPWSQIAAVIAESSRLSQEAGYK